MEIAFDEKTLNRFWSKVARGDGCWLWSGTLNEKGYGVFKFRNRKIRAHRISWCLENGELADDLFVCHSCDTPSCVRPDHLFAGTVLDNSIDMMVKERGVATLTNAQVTEIRREVCSGVIPRVIAARLGIPKNTVLNAVKGTTYKHVPFEPGVTPYVRKNKPPKPRRLRQHNKLTAEDVLEMRRLSFDGIQTKTIAIGFRISENYASEVIRGIKWPDTTLIPRLSA